MGSEGGALRRRNRAVGDPRWGGGGGGGGGVTGRVHNFGESSSKHPIFLFFGGRRKNSFVQKFWKKLNYAIVNRFHKVTLCKQSCGGFDCSTLTPLGGLRFDPIVMQDVSSPDFFSKVQIQVKFDQFILNFTKFRVF